MSKQILTYNGYDMFEVVSALQKSIRRGLTNDAMYWGVELYISNFVSYAWKRLKIIALEDVGLANPYAPVIINALKSIYDELSAREDKKCQNRMAYAEAILYLCMCKKSRYVDWCQNYWFDEVLIDGGKKPIPDYAIDMHTKRGKIMGKTIDDFFDEGSHIENSANINGEEWYKEECRKRWCDDDWNAICINAKDEYNRRCGKVKKDPQEQPQKQVNNNESPTLFDL